MDLRTSISTGQQQARERWKTEESGAAFDRKKTPYLTKEAQEFIAQQSFFVLSGPGRANELDGLLVMGRPGCVQILDSTACLLRLDISLSASPLFQRLQQAFLARELIGLFFIRHATRERLCVQGRAETVLGNGLKHSQFFSSPLSLWVLLHVQQAFFHCAKYIRTNVPGLNVETTKERHWSLSELHHREQSSLSEEVCAFVSQQVLCFLCTRDHHGQCAVNHRGGAAGFLIPVAATAEHPGGRILLPDYTGNGAFEAIGNILETGLATLVIPCYAAHMALHVSGSASIQELDELPNELVKRCVGAERVVSLSVRRVTLQEGDWSETLAYERRFAASNSTSDPVGIACPIQ